MGLFLDVTFPNISFLEVGAYLGFQDDFALFFVDAHLVNI